MIQLLLPLGAILLALNCAQQKKGDSKKQNAVVESAKMNINFKMIPSMKHIKKPDVLVREISPGTCIFRGNSGGQKDKFFVFYGEDPNDTDKFMAAYNFTERYSTEGRSFYNVRKPFHLIVFPYMSMMEDTEIEATQAVLLAKSLIDFIYHLPDSVFGSGKEEDASDLVMRYPKHEYLIAIKDTLLFDDTNVPDVYKSEFERLETLCNTTKKENKDHPYTPNPD